MKEGDSYYLTWDEVEDVKKYTVYKSSKEADSVDDMEKVTETEDNKFEYPFDPDAEQNEYAYYLVQAECEDGTEVNLDGIKKVQVGPMNMIGALLILSVLAYFSKKLVSYTD